MAKPVVEVGPGWFARMCEYIDPNKKVEVYKNLHTGLWSIRQEGIVRCHTKMATLRDAEFIVGPKGRQRVLREKRKNVHAFVRGFLVSPKVFSTFRGWMRVRYNPYVSDVFFLENKDAVERACAVDMMANEENEVLAWGLTSTVD